MKQAKVRVLTSANGRPYIKERTGRARFLSIADAEAAGWKNPKPKPAKKAARRGGGGGRVNARVPLPKPPGRWVDEEKNHVTGEKYEKFRSRCTFADGAEIIRRAAQREGLEGGGFRSRGPVLHGMRVCKLNQWYERAMGDGALWNERANRPYNKRELREQEREARREDDLARDGTAPRRARYKVDPEFGF